MIKLIVDVKLIVVLLGMRKTFCQTSGEVENLSGQIIHQIPVWPNILWLT
jgi:hypothetical protein